MKYNEPIFKVITAESCDVITTSVGESSQTPPNNNYTPGHYDTPIIKL